MQFLSNFSQALNLCPLLNLVIFTFITINFNHTWKYLHEGTTKKGCYKWFNTYEDFLLKSKLVQPNCSMLMKNGITPRGSKGIGQLNLFNTKSKRCHWIRYRGWLLSNLHSCIDSKLWNTYIELKKAYLLGPWFWKTSTSIIWNFILLFDRPLILINFHNHYLKLYSSLW